MRWLLALAAAMVADSASAAELPVATAEVGPVGREWSVEYRLNGDAPVWAFAKSDLPRVSRRSWRAASMRVLTPGVRLVRLGHYDALVGTAGRPLPRRILLRFQPYKEDIESGYDPALVFSDGTVALYTTAFKLVPVRSADELAAAPIDDSKLPGAGRPTHIRFSDRGRPLLFRGEWTDEVLIDDFDAYVLFGKARPVVGAAMTTVIDPALPAWLAEYLNVNLPKVLSGYQRQLGPAPVGKRLLLVAWAGSKEPGVSLSGSVLTGTVVMTVGGHQTLRPNARLSHYARWFVSHEAAHFWLGQAVEYSGPEESWITEGGAELLAFRATAASDPTFDLAGRLGEARAECLPFLKKGGIAGAKDRGDFRAYYACGALLALVAERSAGGDFGLFVRDLIAREGKDRIVTRAEWLSAVERRNGRPDVTAAMADLLDRPSPDPAAAIDRLLAVADVRQKITAPPP